MHEVWSEPSDHLPQARRQVQALLDFKGGQLEKKISEELTAWMDTQSTLVIDGSTVGGLLAALALLLTAYFASIHLLHASTTTKLRIIFIWHLFDALIHFLFEGSFLYHCFFTYISVPHAGDYPHPASLTSPGTHFLGYADRLYGSRYGSSPTAKLWQEYAKADKRWAGADLTVISLELLTVFGAGPLAAYICDLVRQRESGGRLWFWASILATGELYGGKNCIWKVIAAEVANEIRLHDFRTGVAFWVFKP